MFCTIELNLFDATYHFYKKKGLENNNKSYKKVTIREVFSPNLEQKAFLFFVQF